ncbi:MAG: DeoR/GlpR transcriptional regulator [Spirochaetales bacterium]|nr:DeoR/GlpR transcriptional regulator [Spirochaetales bacterium]
MFPEERRTYLLEILGRHGSRSVADLAKDLDVSEVTVRQDLDLLEKQKILRRTHGGAILNTKMGFEPVITDESDTFLEEKKRIGRAAIDLISDGDTIILDASSTVLELARNLSLKKNLTVITNSLNIALLLEEQPDISVIVTGGSLKSGYHSLVNPYARFILNQLHADIAMIGVSGIVAEYGITSANIADAEMKNLFINSSRRCVVLADSSKIGNVSLARIADLSELDILITDKKADPVEVTLLKEKNLAVQLV